MLMAERGLATKWITAATIVPGIQLTFFLFSDRFATERGDVAIRWLAAYLRGARDWQAMLDTGEGRDEMLGYLIKYTALKDRALLDRLALTTPALDGKIDLPGLRQQAVWARERGYIAQDPPLERLIDTRLFEAARQRVGLAPGQ
jgi:NitT/TauT family transport system substrate-binding protein